MDVIRKKETMKQYCLYLRKSRADIELETKGELETLARHEKALLSLAKKMKLNVTQIYKEVVSGETIAARPVVQKLLQEVEDGVWSGVLVMEIERLARGDTADQGNVAKAFKERNTKIITPAKVYDPSNEFDEEYFEFGLFMSRREYKTINRRIQRGRIASVKEGKYISPTPPYGYDRVKIENDKGYTLAPNESEAPVVKIIYDMYLNEHIGCTGIANKLDELNIKPRFKDHWSRASIYDILTNSVYAGKIRWSYKKEKKINTGTEILKRREKQEEYLEVDGLHQGLISYDDFIRVQEMLKKNSKVSTPSVGPLQNPLSGLVYCKKCGRLMTRLAPNSRNKYSTLKCPNTKCDNISSPLSLVEDGIISYMNEWLLQYKTQLDNEFSDLNDTPSIKAKKRVLDKIKEELEKVNSQILNTYDLLEQGIYSVDIFKERNNILSKKKAKLENDIAASTASIKREQEFEQLRSSYIPFVENVLTTYYDLPTAEIRNEALKLIISRVEYQKDTPNKKGQLMNNNFTIQISPRPFH